MIGCDAPRIPAHLSDVTAAVSVAFCSTEAEPNWGEAENVAPLIHHRYGNEPSPDPGVSYRGPPGDQDYRRLQLRATQLSFSPPLRLREEVEEDEKHLEMRSGSPEGNSHKDVRSPLICVF